jgi:hypothetical protein
MNMGRLHFKTVSGYISQQYVISEQYLEGPDIVFGAMLMQPKCMFTLRHLPFVATDKCTCRRLEEDVDGVRWQIRMGLRALERQSLSRPWSRCVSTIFDR